MAEWDRDGRLYVGVDGGGSRCRVRVCDSAGRALGAAEGGSANVYLDFDTAIATIRRTIAVGLAGAAGGAASTTHCHVGLGLAGVSSAAVATRVADALADYAQVRVGNDAVTACLGAHAGADGGLVIAGTGSAAMLRLDGQEINIGGRGFMLGDDGSGAVIGRDIWRRALRAYDGLEPFTPLLRGLMADFSDDPVAVITWGRTATSGQYGAYAPRVIAAAEDGDAAALAILQGAGRSIAELIVTLHRRGAPRISLVGGLAGPLGRYLGSDASALLSAPITDATDGALLLAGAALDLAKDSVRPKPIA